MLTSLEVGLRNIARRSSGRLHLTQDGACGGASAPDLVAEFLDDLAGHVETYTLLPGKAIHHFQEVLTHLLPAIDAKFQDEYVGVAELPPESSTRRTAVYGNAPLTHPPPASLSE